MRAVSKAECGFLCGGGVLNFWTLSNCSSEITNFKIEKTCQSRRKGKQIRLNLVFKSDTYSRAPHSKDAQTNPRGIPYAPFVDKVEDYVSSRAEVDGTMKSFQEMISYAFLNFTSMKRC